ncbi:MAG: response regulator [Kiritimatiellae bacterium]|nr:response regulator [Kiritimatiellia bacterium]
MKTTERRGRVLVVDPDPLFAQRLDTMLSAHDCDVEIVGGITDAVQRLRDVEFDCVIMDEELPEMKGHNAVPVVRAISPCIQIIMTAAQNTSELESKIRQQDILYYYVKGFDVHELQMAVAGALKRKGKTPPPEAGDSRGHRIQDTSAKGTT